MNLQIISLKTFTKQVKKLHKKYKKLPNDLKILKKELFIDPKAGIELGKGCYKIRLANSSVPTGKSAGFRVIYYFLEEETNTIYLMSIYSKKDLENISDSQIIEILNTIIKE